LQQKVRKSIYALFWSISPCKTSSQWKVVDRSFQEERCWETW